MSYREVLERMRAAGLDSLPGGGAEILDEDVRRRIAHGKCNGAQYLEVHRVAHQLGMRTNCTMLYGHIETYAHRVDHLLKLRALQDETGGFQCFIPLAFHNENNALERLPEPTAIDDLKTLAVSRLLLDNIDHIKAYWVMVTPKLAQVALRFGADDMDGTIVEEKIYHMAGAGTSQQLTRSELERIVRLAGFQPVERDTLYNSIRPETAAALAH